MTSLRLPGDDSHEPFDQEFAVVYGELRRLASWHLSGDRGSHTLQATALVHEAYLRLAAGSGITFHSREHFLALASRAMRRILVDYARRRGAAKRGGADPQLVFGEWFVLHNLDEMIDLDRALEELAGYDPRASRIIELSVFGGMSTDQVAEMFDLSGRMIRYEIAYARAWLLERMERGPAPRQTNA